MSALWCAYARSVSAAGRVWPCPELTLPGRAGFVKIALWLSQGHARPLTLLLPVLGLLWEMRTALNMAQNMMGTKNPPLFFLLKLLLTCEHIPLF